MNGPRLGSARLAQSQPGPNSDQGDRQHTIGNRSGCVWGASKAREGRHQHEYAGDREKCPEISHRGPSFVTVRRKGNWCEIRVADCGARLAGCCPRRWILFRSEPRSRGFACQARRLRRVTR